MTAKSSKNNENKAQFGYNTILQLEHFSDIAFKGALRDAFPHWVQNYPLFPDNKETAKTWEVAQCIRAFRDFGILKPDAEVLGVGAGSEMTLFYLTNHVRRVFATDLYATNIDWQEAANGMLVDPVDFAPPNYAWNARRLVVQHMNALDLRYDDNSFDGVFSCGSIEHFGTLENVAQAATEMARVLKPGGILALATEFRLSGPEEGVGIPGAILFTPDHIKKYIVDASGLAPVDAMVSESTPDTIESAYPLLEAIEIGIRDRSIAAIHDEYSWTSGFICLQKPKI